MDEVRFKLKKQGPFELEAVVCLSYDEWWLHEDVYGSFDNERKSPFAVRHRHGDISSFDWFNPPSHVKSEQEAEEAYQKALDYGHKWFLYRVKVEALYEDRVLGESLTLGGIEATDFDEAFQRVSDGGHLDDLIYEAVEEARDFVKVLCKEVQDA